MAGELPHCRHQGARNTNTMSPTYSCSSSATLAGCSAMRTYTALHLRRRVPTNTCISLLKSQSSTSPHPSCSPWIAISSNSTGCLTTSIQVNPSSILVSHLCATSGEGKHCEGQHDMITISHHRPQHFRPWIPKNASHILVDYPSNIHQKKGILKIKNPTLAAQCNQ
jgi:hypothetical protein